MEKATKFFPSCPKCGWSEKLNSPDLELCPRCGNPLLYGCPVCGRKFITLRQQYCGHKDCPAKGVPFPVLISVMKEKGSKYKPLTPEAEEFLKPFLAN